MVSSIKMGMVNIARNWWGGAASRRISLPPVSPHLPSLHLQRAANGPEISKLT